MIALDAKQQEIRYVLQHLRAHNRRELGAVRWDASPDVLELELEQLQPVCIKLFALFEDGGPPAALIGAWFAAPGVAIVRMLATDEWPTIAWPAYRWMRRTFIPCVLEPNVRRAETRVLDTGPASRRWLYRMGFRDEGIARSLGQGGEDFVHVAWINPTGGAPCVSSSAGYSAAVEETAPRYLA